jgi:hypothetical protein
VRPGSASAHPSIRCCAAFLSAPSCTAQRKTRGERYRFLEVEPTNNRAQPIMKEYIDICVSSYSQLTVLGRSIGRRASSAAAQPAAPAINARIRTNQDTSGRRSASPNRCGADQQSRHAARPRPAAACAALSRTRRRTAGSAAAAAAWRRRPSATGSRGS